MSPGVGAEMHSQDFSDRQISISFMPLDENLVEPMAAGYRNLTRMSGGYELGTFLGAMRANAFLTQANAVAPGFIVPSDDVLTTKNPRSHHSPHRADYARLHCAVEAFPDSGTLPAPSR